MPAERHGRLWPEETFSLPFREEPGHLSPTCGSSVAALPISRELHANYGHVSPQRHNQGASTPI